MPQAASEVQAALVLVIEGTRYALRVEPTEPFQRARFSVCKEGSDRIYTVVQPVPPAPPRCECQGFRFKGHCRHIKALRRVRLIL